MKSPTYVQNISSYISLHMYIIYILYIYYIYITWIRYSYENVPVSMGYYMRVLASSNWFDSSFLPIQVLGCSWMVWTPFYVLEPFQGHIQTVTVWLFNIAMGKWPIEIDGLPSYKMVDLSMAMLVITKLLIVLIHDVLSTWLSSPRWNRFKLNNIKLGYSIQAITHTSHNLGH